MKSIILRKIKVCFISHFGYPLYNKRCEEQFGGGAEVQLYLISENLMKYEDFEINILTGDYNCTKNKIELFKNKIKIYKSLPIKRSFSNYIKGLISFFITLRKINPDIIIQRSAGVITGLSSIYCLLFKKKFIYSISSDSNVNGKDEKKILGKLFKFGFDYANYIVAQNYTQIKEIRKRKRNYKHNTFVIKNGIEIENEINQIKETILWVGRAIKLKRPEIFLKLARLFPIERFVMICTKKDDVSYWNSIRKKAQKISNVVFYEYIPFNLIENFFKESKIFINTSIYEGFPNTFIQALKYKTPILSLNVNPDNILKKYKIGFSCNDDYNKLINNLSTLLEDSNQYIQISNNCVEYIKTNHDIQNISLRWGKLIKKVHRTL